MSQAEARRMERLGRSQRRAATAAAITAGPASPEEVARVAAEVARYESVKADFTTWTLALIGVGAATTAVAYSRDVCASYLVGAAGGLLYLRLLGRSVDAMGGGGNLAAGAAGQQRLLIPLILALGYNRWNTLFAAGAGLSLQLPPMLVGFFTYKLAVIARQSLELARELSARPADSTPPTAPPAGAAAAASSQQQGAARS
jgi:ATP synthase protein I